MNATHIIIKGKEAPQEIVMPLKDVVIYKGSKNDVHFVQYTACEDGSMRITSAEYDRIKETISKYNTI